MLDHALVWQQLAPTGSPPTPRQGHRAIIVDKAQMVVFAGGNEGMIEELHVYSSTWNRWYTPAINGDVPVGRAAFGCAFDGTCILVFGGMLEYGELTNDLYALRVPLWTWKKINMCKRGAPSPRMGHSFNMVGQKAYVFGGVSNTSGDNKRFSPQYLNDVYVLEVSGKCSYKWTKPKTRGVPPPPRESHTSVLWIDSNIPQLVVYGGMNGCRLGDLWILNLDTMSWSNPVTCGIPPLPRSLHTSTLVGNRMFVFGGWVPTGVETYYERWKCSDTLLCLNLATMTWEEVKVDGPVPKARAGHSTVALNSRLYLWSGRDELKKKDNHQVCLDDFWFLEIDKPSAVPGCVRLSTAPTTTSLRIIWDSVPTAKEYLLQIQKCHKPVLSSPSTTAGTKPSDTNLTSKSMTSVQQSPALLSQLLAKSLEYHQPHVPGIEPLKPVPQGRSSTSAMSLWSNNKTKVITNWDGTPLTTDSPGLSSVIASSSKPNTVATGNTVVTRVSPGLSSVMLPSSKPNTVATGNTAVTRVSPGLSSVMLPSSKPNTVATGNTAVTRVSPGLFSAPPTLSQSLLLANWNGTTLSYTPPKISPIPTTLSQSKIISNTPNTQVTTCATTVASNSQVVVSLKNIVASTTSVTSCPMYLQNTITRSDGKRMAIYKSKSLTITKKGTQEETQQLDTQKISKILLICANTLEGSGNPQSVLNGPAALSHTLRPVPELVATTNTPTIPTTQSTTAQNSLQTINGDTCVSSGAETQEQITITDQSSTKTSTTSSGSPSNDSGIRDTVIVPPVPVLNASSEKHQAVNLPDCISVTSNASDERPQIAVENATLASVPPCKQTDHADQVTDADVQSTPQEEEPHNKKIKLISTESTPNCNENYCKEMKEQSHACFTVKTEISKENPKSPEVINNNVSNPIPCVNLPKKNETKQENNTNITSIPEAHSKEESMDIDVVGLHENKNTSQSVDLLACLHKDVGKEKPQVLTPTTFSSEIKIHSAGDIPNVTEQWHIVGIFEKSFCSIESYYLSEGDTFKESDAKVNLEPGTEYKLRVAGRNSCGLGGWSASAIYKTAEPGVPPPPSQIKLYKTGYGAHMSWAVPSGNITDYTVSMAVKDANMQKRDANDRIFRIFSPVYCGRDSQCNISNATLKTALIVSSPKPAIIFRVVARNSHGFGAPTQIRWIQQITTNN